MDFAVRMDYYAIKTIGEEDQMEKIDKAAAKKLGAEVQQALEEVAQRNGLSVKVAGGRFDPVSGTFSPKVEFSMSDSEERRFAQLAPLFDLDPETYGFEFSAGGRTYRLTGLNPRAARFPVLAVNTKDGRTYKLGDGVIPVIMTQYQKAIR